MKHKSDRRPALFVLNDATAPRLNPELAKEIGLNESLLFLQLEFWLRQSGTLQEDGQYWIYESVTEIQSVFSFWGRATINRIVHSLEKQQLIQVGNFNKHKYDRTRWFTLNRTGIDRLQSVRIFDWWVSQNETAETADLFQNGTGSDQNGTRSAQNGTTIPDLSPDLSSEIPAVADSAQEPEQNPADAWIERGKELYGGDVLDTIGKRAQASTEPTWTVPAEAGGADPWQDRPLSGFCALTGTQPDDLPVKKRQQIARGLQRIGTEWEAGPDVVYGAIRAIPRSEDYSWLRPTSPYSDSFKDVVGIMITRHRGGQSGGAGVDTATRQPFVIAGVHREPEYL